MAEENNHRFLQLEWRLLLPPQEYFLHSWLSTKTVSIVDYRKTEKDLQAQELEWYKNPWKWKSSAPLPEVFHFCDCSFSTFADEGPQIQNFNLPRECIRKFFPKRKCFVFDRPASNKKQLLHLEEMPDNQLDEDFQKQSKDFCSYIYTHAKTKTLKEGITVTGKSEPPLLEHGSLWFSVGEECVVELKLWISSGIANNCVFFFSVVSSLYNLEKHIYAPHRSACYFVKISLHEGFLKTVISHETVGLAKMFFQVFRKMLWKNPNELFGQPNITLKVC